MRYIEGINRHQSLMFPQLLDEYIDEGNAVCFIDAFVDGLNLLELGFTRSATSKPGRKPYSPADLLKLSIYGYLNKIRSRRQLEESTYRNVEGMGLMRKLSPDFKTIADFRGDNRKALKKVFREFVMLCKAMDLFGCELIAIDGSKFSAVNHHDRNYTKDKLNNLLQEINEKIDAYFAQLQQPDQAESDVKEPTSRELPEKIEHLKERQAKLQQLQEQLEESGESQVSLTDADSRMMKSNKGSDVSYSVQIVTAAKHKLIGDCEVTNDINDMNRLTNMAIKAKNILGVDKIDATADTGYPNEPEVEKCKRENITCYIPKPKSNSSNSNAQLFTKAAVKYDADPDCYLCPANQKLSYWGQTKWSNKEEQKKYRCLSCKDCLLRTQCLGKKRGNRYIYRGIHEDLLDQMEQRMLKNPEIVKKRKELVEHPFGTMKHWMDQGYFLMRGFEKVTAEMSLTALCYNIKRLLNIFDVKQLIANLPQLANNLKKYLFLTLKSKYFEPLKSKYLSYIDIPNFKLLYSIGSRQNH